MRNTAAGLLRTLCHTEKREACCRTISGKRRAVPPKGKEIIFMPTELSLKYGCNPNQKPARVFMKEGRELPFAVLSGRPGYINLLDALNSWQLVRELREATGLPAAASFKHVSPTSAAIGRPLPARLKQACFVDDLPGLDESPLACAYARARGTDRMSSFGDFIALSDCCDVTTAKLIKREVSDGIIAPAYEPEALELLCQKKKGNYCILQMNTEYVPATIEQKDVFGVTFEQKRNDYKVTDEAFSQIVSKNQALSPEGRLNLTIALITLKYTQSNSVCFAMDGQAIGVGAGQQSRIHCTRLAGQKADLWQLRQSDEVLSLPFRSELGRAERDNAIDAYLSEWSGDVLDEGKWQQFFTRRPEPFSEEAKEAYLAGIDGVALGSDAFFPFGDNIERAARSGVRYVAEPGGSIRDDHVIETADRFGMVVCFTGMRLFHH